MMQGLELEQQKEDLRVAGKLEANVHSESGNLLWMLRIALTRTDWLRCKQSRLYYSLHAV